VAIMDNESRRMWFQFFDDSKNALMISSLGRGDGGEFYLFGRGSR
jgi:hypothetical protein